MFLKSLWPVSVLCGAAAVGAAVTDIPQLGLGTWLSDRDKVAHAVEYALETGYNHIDAALIYGQFSSKQNHFPPVPLNAN